MASRNVKEVKVEKNTSGEFNGELVTPDNVIMMTEKEIREPITVTSYEKVSRFLKRKKVKNYNYTKIVGAAGEELIPIQNLKVISDHYSTDTRTMFTNVLLLDPVSAPAGTYRVGALFEDGFELRLTLASQFDPTLGRELTKDEIQMRLKTTDGYQSYIQILSKLITWKNDVNIEGLAKDLEGVSLAQGKAVGQIIPGIMDLPPQALPIAVEIVDADDVGDPIVDAGLTQKLVAIKLKLDDEDTEEEDVKDILRADEMVYVVRGMRGLRRGSKWHGISPLEPIVQISEALKRYYHLDAPLAMVSSYITKQLLKVKSDNFDKNLQTRVQEFMTKLYKANTWAMAMPDWYDGLDQIKPEVDWDMFNGIEQKLAAVSLAQLGVPKSAVNREQDLNRDIATIQAIQFVRFVRKPAEQLIKNDLESQLFNPLFAHLCGKPLSQIPVRVEVVRKMPENGDIDTLFDPLAQSKNEDMNSGNIMQNQSQTDVTTPIGTPKQTV